MSVKQILSEDQINELIKNATLPGGALYDGRISNNYFHDANIFGRSIMELMVKPGRKDDTGKPRASLLPEGVMPEILAVLEHGAAKYGVGNWQHVPDLRTRYYDAALRHISAFWDNQEEIDQESGRQHLAMAITDLMFILSDELKSKK